MDHPPALLTLGGESLSRQDVKVDQIPERAGDIAQSFLDNHPELVV